MPAPLLIGAAINGFRIEKILSQRGNFSIVYEVSDTRSARVNDRRHRVAGRLDRWRTRYGEGAGRTAIDAGPRLAMKEFAPSTSSLRIGEKIVPHGRDRDKFSWSFERFKEEISFLRDHSHPNVVAIFDCFDANDTAYFIMERLTGGALQDELLQRGAQDTAGVLRWLLPIVAAVESVETRRANHLDISPNNIMFRTPGGDPVLVDFGAARLPKASGAGTSSALILDHHYSAPEKSRLSTRALDARCDVYSLAACVYFAMTLRLPPRAAERVADAGPGPDLPTSADPQLRAAFARAFAIAPAERFSSVREFAAMLPRQSPTITPKPPAVHDPIKPIPTPLVNTPPTLTIMGIVCAIVVILIIILFIKD